MSPKVASAVAPARVRGKKHLTLAQRHRIYELILEICVQGQLPRGAMLYVAQQFQCDSRTISRIWSRGRASSRNGRGVADIASKIAETLVAKERVLRTRLKPQFAKSPKNRGKRCGHWRSSLVSLVARLDTICKRLDV
ncbi:hypothetical protein H257_11096 [Aphanomyces astaci]|uniref:DUF7769 domain-containing protein n=1 Tax=Aphanomyces astaci TaxID=112090 RepID=W4G4D5_APHAT|nr:hypothetical protein H257_11096 [Aphanomyces astaci]ETV74131.1 hypothetical protein H257_11096 [Aphanomyces astaci]|eukprot:XP_009836237.1 hypothetical protein H257_11096 [Aphanomyces astaci]